MKGSKKDVSEAQTKVGKLQAIAAVAAHDKEINAVAISPNDALLCSASQDRTAKVGSLDIVQLGSSLHGC